MINIKANTQTLTDVTLAKFKTWTVDGNRCGDEISCLSGRLWVTQEGDLMDYVIEPGKSFWVTRAGTVVVQALDNSKFKYSLNEMQDHVEKNNQPLPQTARPHITNPR